VPNNLLALEKNSQNFAKTQTSGATKKI